MDFRPRGNDGSLRSRPSTGNARLARLLAAAALRASRSLRSREPTPQQALRTCCQPTPSVIKQRQIILPHRFGHALAGCRFARLAQRPHAHTQQPDAPIQRHALEALAGGATNQRRILRRQFEGAVARHRLEIVIAYFQSYGLAGVALAREVAGDALVDLASGRLGIAPLAESPFLREIRVID